MEFALYDPQAGYYARAAHRSGRAGDFFTSVDVGPLFGELLAVQIAEMARILAGGPDKVRPASVAAELSSGSPDAGRTPSGPAWDLVEAGAGNGRLSADI